MNGKKMKKIFFSLMLLVLVIISLSACKKNTDQSKVDAVLDKIEEAIEFDGNETKDGITKNITLKAELDGVAITWTSNKEDVLNNLGEVNRPSEDTLVTLTANLKLNKAVATKGVVIKVLKAIVLDTIAPAFLDLVDGKLTPLKHLTCETIDLLANVKALDNKDLYDVKITVSDNGGYDKNVSGVYTITYQAEDNSGNKATVKRVVTVEEALRLVINALLIGDNFIEYVKNSETAFEATSSYGAKFRESDLVYVMDKSFFFDQLEAHKDGYPQNNGLVYLPYGSLFITDKDLNILHVRISSGAYIEIDEAGEAIHTDVIWNDDKGGNMFTAIYADNVPEGEQGFVIPDDGMIFFTSSIAPQRGRIFINNNFFNSEYVGGAMYMNNRNVLEEDFVKIELQMVENYEIIIPKPDALATPEATLTRHTLSWNEVPNARGYHLYVNGDIYEEEGLPLLISGKSIDLSKINLTVSDTPYEIGVVAVTVDQYKYSSSIMSNVVSYTKAEIVPISEVPVLSATGKQLSWEKVEGAESYDIYVKFAVFTQKIGNTEALTFDLSDETEFNGKNHYYIIAAGDMYHSDSAKSNDVLVDMVELSAINIGGSYNPVVVTNPTNYFHRRNSDLASPTKLEEALYLVKDIHSVKDLLNTAPFTESGGFIALLDSNYNVKIIRNIVVSEYRKADGGWFTGDNTTYKVNSAQLAGIATFVEEGDMLLIGKNNYNVESFMNNELIKAAARDTLAYFLVKPWPSFPAATAAGTVNDGWRGDITTFVDPSEVEITLDDVYQKPIKLETPVIAINEAGLVSWQAVNNASKYQVYVDGVMLTEVTTNEFDAKTIEGEPINPITGYVIKVKAIASGQIVHSDLSNEVILEVETELVQIEKPVVTISSENVLSFDAVSGAIKYEVYYKTTPTAAAKLLEEIINTTLDLKLHVELFQGETSFFVKALGNPATHIDAESDSVKSIVQASKIAIFDGMEIEVFEIDAHAYFTRRNEGTTSAKLPTGLYLVTNIFSVKDELGAGLYTEAFSTVILLDSTYQTKRVRNIMVNEWSEADGWKAGGVYASNGAQLVGFKDYVTSGDMLLIGKNGINVSYKETSEAEAKTIASRDFVAYHYIATWTSFPTAPAGSDGYRNADLSTLKNPKGFTFTFKA